MADKNEPRKDHRRGAGGVMSEQRSKWPTTKDKRIADLEALFELRWKADQRAIKMWQAAHPGNELIWPDHADLSVWLCERLAEVTQQRDEERKERRRALRWAWTCACAVKGPIFLYDDSASPQRYIGDASEVIQREFAALDAAQKREKDGKSDDAAGEGE